MDAKIIVPLRLKALRESMGYSPKDFAAYLNIKQHTYYVYEYGRTLPSLNILIKIAETCNVSLDWLCGVTEEQYATSKKKEISDVLSQLLKANKKGNQIEVRIVCQGR